MKHAYLENPRKSKKLFKKSQSKNYLAGEFIHSDVNGPMPVVTYGGNKCFVTFIDDATGMTFVFFIKTKDEVFDKFKIVLNLIETQLNRKVKVLRSDNNREYVNGKIRSFMEDRGMDHQTIAPIHRNKMGWLNAKTAHWWNQLEQCYLQRTCHNNYGQKPH